MPMDIPTLYDSLTSGSGTDANEPAPFVYDERSFNRMVARERKRTERSKRQFILLLLSRSEIQAGENDKDLCDKIISSLADSIRDIDLMGWHKTGKVIGIICPEIDDSSRGLAVKSILDRVNGNLALNLDADEREKIEVSVYVFPEALSLPDSTADLALYPDIQNLRSAQRFPLFIKRLIDIIGSLLALVVLSPVFLILSVLIKATSEGPVLFRQRRVGRYGKPFIFLKFRSMYINNDSAIHREYVKSLICSSKGAGGKSNGSSKEKVFKIQNDPRVTKVGRFIRKTSLDELPQFINVLKGEMSLVGPRPPIPYECENYEIWHKRRILDMKPGITGLWQVEGRSRTTFDEMVRLDIYYIRNWSLWLDIKILLQTPWAVLTRNGAY